jgi:hypothetical protein
MCWPAACLSGAGLGRVNQSLRFLRASGVCPAAPMAVRPPGTATRCRTAAPDRPAMRPISCLSRRQGTPASLHRGPSRRHRWSARWSALRTQAFHGFFQGELFRLDRIAPVRGDSILQFPTRAPRGYCEVSIAGPRRPKKSSRPNFRNFRMRVGLLKQGANFQNWGEVEVGIEPTVLFGNL